MSDDEILASIGVGGSTVYRTTRRFVEGKARTTGRVHARFASPPDNRLTVRDGGSSADPAHCAVDRQGPDKKDTDMPPMPRRQQPDQTEPSISPPDELIQLGFGRTADGYAFESAESMIAGLGRITPPSATDRQPAASVAEQQMYVLSSRLRALDRLLADVSDDVDDEEMRVLHKQAARVSSNLIAAYGNGNGRIPVRPAPAAA